MMAAAEVAGLKVRQPHEFIPEEFDAFAPDVALAVRKATVILADGTPQQETEKPDADVMFEVGLAEAFAKPVVFVTTRRTKPMPLPIFVCDGSCSRVEYDPDEGDLAVRLQKEITKELLGIVKKKYTTIPGSRQRVRCERCVLKCFSSSNGDMAAVRANHAIRAGSQACVCSCPETCAWTETDR